MLIETYNNSSITFHFTKNSQINTPSLIKENQIAYIKGEIFHQSRLKEIIHGPKPSQKLLNQIPNDKNLPCKNWKKIVETEVSNIGYSGVLKQINLSINNPILIRFTSGKRNLAHLKYSTTEKDILFVIKCIHNFQEDLLNQCFILQIDYDLAKSVTNISSKQIFARRQTELFVYNFSIELIEKSNNLLPDYLTHEFLHNQNEACS